MPAPAPWLALASAKKMTAVALRPMPLFVLSAMRLKKSNAKLRKHASARKMRAASRTLKPSAAPKMQQPVVLPERVRPRHPHRRPVARRLFRV